MKILRFQANKLHGYLNFRLNLDSNLVFLTGINGAGKTSAVRSITALLTPSFVTLSDMEYDLMSVTVSVNDRPELTIQSRQSKGEIVLSCSDVDGDLRIPVLRKEIYETAAQYSGRQKDFYREQEAINIQNPILSAIDNLPTPMFLDLDRRYQEGVRPRLGGDRYRVASANPLAGSLRDSLEAARNLAERTYRKYLADRTERTDNLKQEIVLAAFRLSSQDQGRFEILPSANELRDIQKKVARYEKVLPVSLAQIGVSAEKINEIVLPFFGRARTVFSVAPSVKDLSKLPINEETIKRVQEWSALSPRFRQIDQLVALIERYNSEVSALYSHIGRYLMSVNTFLADSDKEVTFDGSGNLKVFVNVDSESRPVTALSSGERQLVVILTHLAFNPQAKRANVLIIDEPELSLHLRWQERFVDAVLEASPGIQLILATHSPSIIRGRLESCIDVQEAHQSDSLFA